MSRFYIREVDVKLCEKSRDTKIPITIMGRTDEGLSRPYKGVVEAIEHDIALGIVKVARHYASLVQQCIMKEPTRSPGALRWRHLNTHR